ncbi:terminase small subunit [Clostridium botulinum]|uniref:terminase small subunit n=1 Tax=Clostridium botulinum TaxID=1491 RepID=UPI000A177B61|nr:terminase small subunit [Clostridium botulinum]MBO0569962.1 terminase small subunit [Clostridium botulinum]MBY6879672.1 terminase small subunit [Clostridium botulinum]NEZ85994.1 terminase small subunit [Clostridium botulinum]NFB02644.1 terminase small subunit [Clostridium botulinum]NFE32642.1 terminase small subunit [Clostridium botulinum]
MAKLTHKQKKFCDEYLIDLNVTQAAIRSGYSKKYAMGHAYELLDKPKIKEYVDKKMKDREKRTEITQDKVLQELAKIAFANGADFAKVVEKTFMKPIYDKEGNKIDEEEVFYKDVELTLTDDLPEDKKKAIAAIKQTKFGIEVASCDKVKALELLGKHLGMFTDKVEVNGNMKVNNPFEDLTTDQLLRLAGAEDG